MAWRRWRAALLLCLFSAHLPHVTCLPGGAPAAACASLRPRHGSHSPQSSAPPYQLVTERNQDGTISVSVLGEVDFQGLLLRARAASGGEVASPRGRFMDAPKLSLLNCGGHNQSALTHTSPEPKSAPLEVHWQPAAGVADDFGLVFEATVVQRYNVWWQGLRATHGSVQTAASERQSARLTEAGGRLAALYAGCGSRHGCFGVPNGCVTSRDCDALATYASSEAGLRVTLVGRGAPKYAALGISSDDDMGSDQVIFCTNEADSSPAVSYGYNTGRSSEILSAKNPDGVMNLETWEEDGHFACMFMQNLTLKVPGKTEVDLSELTYLLIATGDMANNQPSYHQAKRAASSGEVNLTELVAVQASDEVPALITAHAICMTLAWAGMAGIGILSATHMKFTWLDRKICGTDVWFMVHRGMMGSTAVLTWIGFALIATHVGGLHFDHTHNIVGFVAFLISILQVLGGLLRPNKDSSVRPAFNVIHRMFGIMAHSLALAALFLAHELSHPGLPLAWLAVMAAVVAAYVITTLTLEFARCCTTEESSPIVAPQPTDGQPVDAPGGRWRKMLYYLYVCCALLLTAGLIAIICISKPGRK